MLFIAEDQHFFEANGINFTTKTYDTGLATIDDLLNVKWTSLALQSTQL